MTCMHTQCAAVSAGEEHMVAKKGQQTDGKHHSDKEQKHYVEIGQVMAVSTNVLRGNKNKIIFKIQALLT